MAFDGYENLTVELDDGIAVVFVSRPEALNAMNDRTLGELETLFTSLGTDEAVKAVVVTGAGDKAFVAGADIAELAEMTPRGAGFTSEKGQRVFGIIEDCPKVVVAAVNGFALGGGLELALACHVRFVAEGAKLGLPEVTLALIPGYGGTQRLARLCGVGRALELILSGDMVDADTAYRLGIANRVVPKEELLDTAKAFAAKVAARGPVAVKYALEAVLMGASLPLGDGLAIEQNLFSLCFTTQDMREGTRAFLEKRKPEFRGD